MSVRRRHRTRSVTVALAATVVLVGTTGSVAAADPPALNSDPCATALFQAATWPGTLSDGTRLVSDAFVSYQSRQAPCSVLVTR